MKSTPKGALFALRGVKTLKDFVEQFAEACQQKGVSQAGALMDFMKKFIEENK